MHDVVLPPFSCAFTLWLCRAFKHRLHYWIVGIHCGEFLDNRFSNAVIHRFHVKFFFIFTLFFSHTFGES
jgi:hypothetical protein